MLYKLRNAFLLEFHLYSIYGKTNDMNVQTNYEIVNKINNLLHMFLIDSPLHAVNVLEDNDHA